MNKTDIHARWAPAGAAWTPWVKPVLFASLDAECAPKPLGPLPAWIRADVIEPLEQQPGAARGEQPYRRSPRLDDVAVVIDLPGAEGLLVAVALAQHGFRPIPLYNAIPAEASVVDQQPIMDALVNGAAELAALPPNAPPAFVLDADRMGRGRPCAPGHFDNRSICFPTDFPSARALWSAGIRRAVLIRRDGERPEVDLAEALITWQEQGIAFFVARTDTRGPAQPRTLARASWLRRMLHELERHPMVSHGNGVFGRRLALPGPSAG